MVSTVVWSAVHIFVWLIANRNVKQLVQGYLQTCITGRL